MDRASRGRVRAAKEAAASEVPPGARVLEIGCGTGELAGMLASRGATVEGFDLSPSMVAAAAERIEAEGLGRRFTVGRMGVDGMDGLPAGAYDAVVSTLVFSELTPDERRFAMREAARVLRPGGLVVIADEVVPRTRGRRSFHALMRAPLLAATFLISRSSTSPIPDLAEELAGAGFAIEKEVRSHGDAFALVVGRRAAEGAEP